MQGAELGEGGGSLDPAVVEALREISTATLSMVLLKQGIRSTWMRGPVRVAGPERRVVGEAFTVRFVPAREDLATPESYVPPGAFGDAIEACPAGAVMVIDARACTLAATLGDILVARLASRGAAAAVTDAPVRDLEEIRKVGLAVFAPGAAAPPSITGLSYAGFGDLVGCGGVAVATGDVVVGDGDGVVVVPRAVAGQVVESAAEQERFERYVQLRVKGGAPVHGLYPPGESALADYRAWLEAGEPAGWPA